MDNEQMPAHFPEIYKDAKSVESIFPTEGSTYITHEGATPVLSPQYLQEAGMPQEAISQLFNEKGEWIFPPIDIDPYSLTPEEAIDRILPQLAPVYQAAQKSLAKVNWFGYNDHSERHIEPVAKDTVSLLQQAGQPTEVQLRGALAGLGHDIFNLFNRDIHSYGAVALFEKILPQIANDPEAWFHIRNAMVLHNEPAKRALMKHLKDAPAAERVEYLERIYSPEALALWIADKTEHGRGRVNDKALSPEAFEVHKHSAINLFMQTEGLDYQDNKFVWSVRFKPSIQEDEMERFGPLATHKHDDGTYDAYVPTLLRENPEDPDSPASFRKAHDQFWQINEARAYGVVEAAYALFPNLQQVDVSIEGPAGESMQHKLTLNTLDELIQSHQGQHQK